MNSEGANWWGYAEGNDLVLAVFAGVVVLFAGAYLVQRFRESRAPNRDMRR